MTSKERLEHYVANLGEADAFLALELLQSAMPIQSTSHPQRELPAFVGIGRSSRTDLSERVDEILDEGFGR